MEQASNNCASSEVFCDGKKLSLGLEVVSARLGVANLAVGLFPWHKDIETQSENSTVGSFADVNDMNQRKLHKERDLLPCAADVAKASLAIRL
jgi:hypothetical protein